MMNTRLFSAMVLLLLILGGCNVRQTPGFHGISLTGITPDAASGSLTLEFKLRFRYTNPTGETLWIPPHQLKFFLDNKPVFAPGQTFGNVQIAAHQFRDIEYPVKLVITDHQVNQVDIATLATLEKIPFKMVTSVGVPQFPNQFLDITFEDELVVPRLPKVTHLGVPNIQLVGKIATLRIHDLLDPVMGLVNAIPSGTPGLGDIKSGLIALGNLPDPINPDPTKSKITGIKVTIPLSVENPNAFAISVPSAQGSLASASGPIIQSRLAPASSIPNTPDDKIPANSTRAMTLTTELNWDALPLVSTPGTPNTSVPSDPLSVITLLLSGRQTDSLTLKAETVLDFGYGPVKIPVSASVPLKVGP